MLAVVCAVIVVIVVVVDLLLLSFKVPVCTQSKKLAFVVCSKHIKKHSLIYKTTHKEKKKKKSILYEIEFNAC